jgi:hypothetical protein
MSEKSAGYDPSYSRQWRGNYHFWQAAARRYDFPVTTYKVGPDGERQLIETANR